MTGQNFDAVGCAKVVAGHCVCMTSTMDQIAYAGPIQGAPEIDGMLVFLNPVDLELLRAVMAKRKH
jgi:hypothetical protein